MTPLHDLSAVELLAAYRSKALSPVEVTRSVLAHMHKWEPHLHATWALEGNEALAQAGGHREGVRSLLSPHRARHSRAPQSTD